MSLQTQGRDLNLQQVYEICDKSSAMMYCMGCIQPQFCGINYYLGDQVLPVERTYDL